MRVPRGEQELIETLLNRSEILDRVGGSPAHKRDLIDELGQSRSTVDRAVSDLEALDLVEVTDEGIAATTTGRLTLDHFDRFRGQLDDVAAVRDLLEPLPSDTPLSTAAIVGSETAIATDPIPFACLQDFHDDLEDAVEYRAIVPNLGDPRHIRVLYEHVVTEQRPAELVVTPELFDFLRSEYPRRMATMADTGQFSFYVAETTPPYSMVLTRTGEGEPLEATLTLVVFNDSGSIHGVLRNESVQALRWAKNEFEATVARAELKTDDLNPDADGGTSARAPPSELRPDEPLSMPLDRQGFVRLDRSYFQNEPVLDPETAWRTGFSIPEVQTGFALERYSGAPAESTADEGSLSEGLATSLAEGTDCLVLGPAGSGKSTTCKRVACRWYRDDRGSVLYRESGEGRSFEAVDELASTIHACRGHTLVVVEDAVRVESNAIFDVIDRFDDREDVSFLLDAREGEWRNPPEPVSDNQRFEIIRMPSLDRSTCGRIAEQFEATTDRSVPLDIDAVYEDLQSGSSPGANASDFLSFVHRLMNATDPETAKPTPLEDEVAELYRLVADDERTLSLSLLANALNAAGIGVREELLYAVADDEADFEAVDAALETIEGRLFFPTPDGRIRMVHESWSVAFLMRALEDLGEDAAAARFGDVVSNLLALADSQDRRMAIGTHVDETRTLLDVGSDPGGWTADVVEQLYQLGRAQPKLAPLFGDTDTIRLPENCPERIRNRRLVWLGELFVAASRRERAAELYDSLPDGDPELQVERFIGLAQIAREGGDYERAEALIRQALEQVEGSDMTVLHGRVALELGQAMHDLGESATAREWYRTAVDRFEAVGESRYLAATLYSLGALARFQDDPDDAVEYVERSLDIARSIGDTNREAACQHELGAIEVSRANYPAAREQFQASYALHRELGDCRTESMVLISLGVAAMKIGDFDAAETRYEEALDLAREVDIPVMEVSALQAYSSFHCKRGDLEAATALIDRGLDLARDLGQRRTEANFLHQTGRLAVQRGRYETALGYLNESMDIADESGYTSWKCSNLNALGITYRRTGDPQRAREAHERVLDLEAAGSEEAIHALRELADLDREDGRLDEARRRLADALEKAKRTGDVALVAQVRLARARLAFDRGDVDKAREEVVAACETFLEMDLRIWIGRCRRLQGRIAAATDEFDAAISHWDDALDRFDEVDAHHDALSVIRYAHESTDPDGGTPLSRLAADASTIIERAPAAVREYHRDVVDALRPTQ